ncbi:hypothetical protein [Oscillatoria sp. FACHB-1406]|uniref:hypothetical protein n=1 Tax=Oscillatoria sp. FACHB-1406 TaxID=2692846 RepID=UPI00168810E2|nr:hypothetical protein [Oscillatoria sp. FACHB-1406]MBD2578835.1 hypothetical protein [Oscillatoria sp. FACHB-1406]
MELQTKELKFLLELLGKKGYRASISELKPNAKMPTSERDRIFRQLRQRELVDGVEEITHFKIDPAGKALLEIAAEQSLLTLQELKVLRACETGTITPGKTGVPSGERAAVIQSLRDRGVIQAVKTQIKEVWLAERGKLALAKEFEASGGGNITLSKKMLGNYLKFLRKFLVADNSASSQTKPSDEEILARIVELDRSLGTNNYLPIFHLREKLQPPLSRTELDEALYRLQEQDKIELSSLVEANAYTPEQVDAGIPQPIGGSLFFIMLS